METKETTEVEDEESVVVRETRGITEVNREEEEEGVQSMGRRIGRTHDTVLP